MALILLPAAGLGAELPSSRLGGKSAAGDVEDHAGVLGPGQAERQRELCTRRTEPGTAQGSGSKGLIRVGNTSKGGRKTAARAGGRPFES